MMQKGQTLAYILLLATWASSVNGKGDFLGRERFCTRLSFKPSSACVCNNCFGYKGVCAIAEASAARCYAQSQVFGRGGSLKGPDTGRCSEYPECTLCQIDYKCYSFPFTLFLGNGTDRADAKEF